MTGVARKVSAVRADQPHIMKITVLISTYRRPSDLARCLDALVRQSRAPDEVLVVCRPGDEETLAWLASERARARLPIRKVEVGQSGQVCALNAGLDALTGDIVAITDDNAVPRPEWLARIERHFDASPDVAGVGGRAWAHEYGVTLDDSARDPDHLQFPDYAFTNHRVDAGGTRDVHYLKSANMSYRMSAVRGSAVRFDTRLRGMGVQLNHDMAFGLAVRRAGWRLAYDPAVEVDGYPLRPCIEDVRILRGSRAWLAIENESYNLHLILHDEFGEASRWMVRLWIAMVGHGGCMGWVDLAYASFTADRAAAMQRWRASRSGAAAARRALAHAERRRKLAARGFAG
jgi:glycosyltransferase involved in cell wall biosynthesis